MDTAKSAGDDEIRLQVNELRRLSEIYGSGATIFEPCRSTIDTKDSNGTSGSSTETTGNAMPAPEKKLTLFALRLAVFEKAATGLGTLGFIWATVVLLGGFAITLDPSDFWFITVILLIEGTRIFSRSHELEWQHQATWSITDVGINSFRALRTSSHFVFEALKSCFKCFKPIADSRELREGCDVGNCRKWECEMKRNRTWTSSDVPILPYAQWVFVSRNISKLLYWLQLASATACVVLSLMKLIKHNYGEVEKGDTDKRNRKAALGIFYALSLAEALLFLMEKAYWEWKVSYCKLLEEVNNECELGVSGIISIRRFFYDSYSRCVNGSIFDGLKMDLVTFAMDLLGSNSPDEQLIGVRILRQLAMSKRFSDDTLQKIGTNSSVIERLVEMLNWKDPQEEVIRRSAAEVLSELAGKKQNSLRVAGIPGAMESISSLLQTCRSSNTTGDEIGEKQIITDHAHYAFWTFNHLGLHILKKLAHDHDNCGKIGNTRGLLPKIIDLTHARSRLLKDESITHSQLLTMKRSLQLVRMLASTSGATGNHLRREISEIVFTISNIRDILRHGEKHPILQTLSIEILTCLALESDSTERIGGTGGVLKELFVIFFNNGAAESQNHVRTAAGEALAMLALESRSNCHRILKLKVLEKLVDALEIKLLRVNAARILRNLCAYSGADCYSHLKGVTASIPTVSASIPRIYPSLVLTELLRILVGDKVVRAIMSEDGKLQEVMVGLAAEVFKYSTSEESNIVFEQAGIKQAELAAKIVQILQKNENPSTKVPRIRRFAIELAIWMMKENTENINILRKLGFERELEHVLETTAELESFNIFSGTVGLSRHSTSIHSLVETALNLLAKTHLSSYH